MDFFNNLVSQIPVVGAPISQGLNTIEHLIPQAGGGPTSMLPPVFGLGGTLQGMGLGTGNPTSSGLTTASSFSSSDNLTLLLFAGGGMVLLVLLMRK